MRPDDTRAGAGARDRANRMRMYRPRTNRKPDTTGTAVSIDSDDSNTAPKNAPAPPGRLMSPTTRQLTLPNRQ
jgi:hypothetical protein